jgi:hypothetical protein
MGGVQVIQREAEEQAAGQWENGQAEEEEEEEAEEDEREGLSAPPLLRSIRLPVPMWSLLRCRAIVLSCLLLPLQALQPWMLSLLGHPDDDRSATCCLFTAAAACMHAVGVRTCAFVTTSLVCSPACSIVSLAPGMLAVCSSLSALTE